MYVSQDDQSQPAGNKLAVEPCMVPQGANCPYAQQQCAPDAGCQHLGDKAGSIKAGADVCTVLQQAGWPLPASPHGASLAALCGQPVYQHLVINNAPELDADQVFTQCLFLLPYLLLLVLTSTAYRRHMSGLLDSCKRASVNQLVQAPVLEVLNRSKSSDLSTFAVQLVLAPRVASPRSLPLLLVQQDKSILHHWHVSQACLCPMQADEEGDNMDFESLMSQLFEVLITLVGNQRHHHLMQPIVPELIYLTIGNNSPLVFCLVNIQALVLKWRKTECRSHAASKFRVSISMPYRLSSLSLNFNFV